MTAVPPTIEARLQELPKGLREHVARTREQARDLARLHGADAARVDLAVAAHDLARGLKGDALLKQARRYRLRIHPVQRQTPTLLHGPVAAAWVEREAGVTDGEVLEAVRWHTTGKKGMGPVAKVVFLADKLDPWKVKREPYLEKVRILSEQSVDRAILEYLDRELEHLIRQGRLIHPASVELRNELIVVLEGDG